MGWQPIETAPRDGRWIIVTGWRPASLFSDEDDGFDEAPVRVVRRCEGHTSTFLEPAEIEGLFRQVKSKQPDFWGTEIGGSVADPTHWMPLPEPPTLAGGPEAGA